MDKSAHTNRSGMEHVSLLVINVGSTKLTVGGARPADTIIHSNQVNADIDRWGHGDQNISLGSL